MRLGVVSATPPDSSRRARLDVAAAALIPNTHIEVIEADTHAALFQLFAHAGLELAWFTPAMVVEASRRVQLALIATSVRSFRAEYRGALVVRLDSAIEQIEDLRGRAAGWVDPWSAAGYLFPRRALRAAGFEPAELFSDQRFYGTHPAAVAALMKREIDVAAIYDPQPGSSKKPGSDPLAEVRDGLRVILRTDPIPADALCASDLADPALVERLKTALLDKPGVQLARLLEAEGFAFETLDAYRPVREALDEEWGRTSTEPPPRRR